MNNWTEYKIEEIADVVGGGTPSTKVPQYYGGNIPWLTPKDLTNYTNRFIAKGERNITKEGLSNSSARMVPKNTILLTSRAPIGYMAIATNDVCTNQGFKSIVVNPRKADYNFVYYLLKANMEYIKSYGTGTTFAEISASVVKNLKFKLPDLPTQTAIAEILSSLDDKIELNNKINQELENLAQTLFKQWFIDFEFPNQNGEPYKSSGGEMVDSELSEIPKGWEVIKIQDFGEVVCGKTPSKKISEYYGNDMPFIKIPDMHNNTYIVNAIDNLSVKGYKSQSNKTLPKNSIVVSSIATVGLVAITSEPSQTNQQINSIIPKDDWLTFYIYDLCKSLNDTFIQLASGGSATLNMNTSTFKNISVLLPNKAVLKEYHLLIVNLFEQIEMNIRENQELTNLRDTLLPKLISGELEVAEVMAEKA